MSFSLKNIELRRYSLVRIVVGPDRTFRQEQGCICIHSTHRLFTKVAFRHAEARTMPDKYTLLLLCLCVSQVACMPRHTRAGIVLRGGEDDPQLHGMLEDMLDQLRDRPASEPGQLSDFIRFG